ncbi:MAG: archaemetzincin family Zn-dependent metalloprotease [Candidatus Latescibacterota bacterium]
MSVGSLEPMLLAGLAGGIAEVLECRAMDVGQHLDPAPFFDAGRRQYWSTAILRRLEEVQPPGTDRVLGVADVDLFIPILTFVFGEALLDRPPAIISTHRLRPSFYGLPPDPALAAERARREAVHELGHTFGLVHCADHACVMRASRVADEIDLKGPGFCRTCTRALHRAGVRVR